jgi:hypothetical protein
MISAREAYETVEENLQTEASAVLKEIDERIKDLINIVNVPVYDLCWEMVKGVYPIVEQQLTAMGYTVTKSDSRDTEKVSVTIGWHNPERT